ncbi:MAG: metallophosphoesterase [Armatimonadota bacterium]|nr:metallophosphoesterase [bacterium]
MRFIHAADIHLDSPLRGLAYYEGAPVEDIRGATRRALENLVNFAADPSEEIAFVLISGDLYDGDWRDYSTGLFFAKQMSILQEAGVPVFVVRGNHDAESQITKLLKLPPNVTVFSPSRPETKVLDDIGVAIHGQSFASRGVATDLASGYPDAIPAMLNIGVLHTSASGYSGHDECAPCSTTNLAAKGYDYWALGHIHTRQEVCRPEDHSGLSPWVVFSGNTQGRHARETGPKGCTVVTALDGEITAVEHRDLDVVRWYRCIVDAADAVTPEEILHRVQQEVEAKKAEAPEHLLALRVEIRGACAAHSALCSDSERWTNQICADALSDQVWIEKVKMLTEDPDSGEDAQQWNELLDSVSQVAQSTELQQRLLSGLAELESKLPLELRNGDDPISLSDPQVVIEALPEVKQLLLSRLLGKEA